MAALATMLSTDPAAGVSMNEEIRCERTASGQTIEAQWTAKACVPVTEDDDGCAGAPMTGARRCVSEQDALPAILRAAPLAREELWKTPANRP